MFKRHRTGPDREISSVARALHERLAGTPVTTSTDPRRIDTRNVRGRLGTPAVGLRERIDRRVSAV
jgi:hypothetical protein